MSGGEVDAVAKSPPEADSDGARDDEGAEPTSDDRSSTMTPEDPRDETPVCEEPPVEDPPLPPAGAGAGRG